VTTFSAAVIRSSIIAKAVGQMLPALFRSGLDANKFHCVGHSIGGEYGPFELSPAPSFQFIYALPAARTIRRQMS
jgi:hypothetical protein